MINTLKQHKRLVISSLLLLCLIIGVTLATLKDKSNTLTNTFTVGSVESTTEEPTPTPDGDVISKQPYVRNTGKNPALVRARVSISPQKLVDEYNIDVTLNSNFWVEYNGYYYYKNILEVGKQTEPIFTEVTGSDIVQDGQINVGLDGLEIAIYHESIQTVVLNGDGTTNIIATTGDVTDSYDTSAKRVWEIFDSLNDVN